MKPIDVVKLFLLLAATAGLTVLPAPPVDNSAPRWVDPSTIEARTYDRFQREFGTDEVYVVHLSGGKLKSLLEVLEKVHALLHTDPMISRVISLQTLLGQAYPSLKDRPDAVLPSIRSLLDAPRIRGLSLFDVSGPTAVVYGLSKITPSKDKEALVDGLQKIRKDASKKGVTLRFAGNPLINLELDRAGDAVERRSMPILIAVCVVLLLAITRSPVLTALVLAPAGMTVQSLTGALGLFLPSTNIVINIAKPLLFVLLFAASVHLVTAWTEACRSGLSPRDAARGAVRKKRKAILLALLTTAVGFGSLAFSDVPPIRHFGLLVAAGLAHGALYVLVLLPILLPYARPPKGREAALAEAATWLMRLGLKYRRAMPMVAVLVVFGGGAAGAFLRADPHAIRYFRADHPLRADHETLENSGLGLAAAEIVLRSNAPLLASPTSERIGEFALMLTTLPGVKTVVDPLMLRALLDPADRTKTDILSDFITSDGRTARISLLTGSLSPEEQTDLSRNIRTSFDTVFRGEMNAPGLEITGNYALLLATQAGLLQTLKSSLLITVALMALIFAAALRSARAAVLAMLPNLFPVCLNFLLMYAMEMPLDVGTSMTAAIALGIAVDDTLHICVAWNRNDPEQTARSTGQAVILSSLVIGAGFLSLVISDFTPTRNFGILAFTAMASALLADLLVMPSLAARMWPAAPREEGRP